MSDADRALRILFVSSEHSVIRGTGGVGSYVGTISRALQEAGHEVHVLSCLPGASPTDAVDEGVALHVRPVLRLPGLGRLARGVQTERRLALALSNYWHARSLGRFDAVEAPDWQAEGLVFALLRRRVVTHLHTPHSVLDEFNFVEQDRDARRADALERWTVRRSAAITCPSQLLVDHLNGKGWLGDRKVKIIRYPVEWSRFGSATAEPDDPPSVLTVGRIERRKAPERVVEALAVLRSRGIEGTAVFIGRSSGMREGVAYADWLRDLADARGVPCEFRGELMWNEVPAAYAASRVVCAPSEFESFCLAAAEGMAAARPVVMSATVGATEVLARSPNRQIVGPRADELADALARFLLDPEEAAEIGRSNQSLLIAECDPRVVAMLRADLYGSLKSHRDYRT